MSNVDFVIGRCRHRCIWRGAFLGLSYLLVGDRLRLARDVVKLAHRRWASDDGLSFDQWLSQHSRSADLRERFWDVILVSALSETADRMAVPHARKVFVDGFLANRDGWRVQIPTVPLDELYGRRLTEWLTQQGVTVRTLAGVSQLRAGEESRSQHLVWSNQSGRSCQSAIGPFAIGRGHRSETSSLSRSRGIGRPICFPRASCSTSRSPA